MNKKELFEKAYKGSYYTIVGVADEKEYKEGYQKIFDENNIGKVKEWYSFTGKDFNEMYNPEGVINLDRVLISWHFLLMVLI